MWKEKNHQLVLKVKFKDFKQAFFFLKKVAKLAESQQHHPDIFNHYNKVELRLSTYDRGNIITEKDRVLAKKIEKLI